MADLVQLIVFNLNHESCMAKDVERELLEEYRLALVGSEGFPEEDAAAFTADELYQQYVAPASCRYIDTPSRLQGSRAGRFVMTDTALPSGFWRWATAWRGGSSSARTRLASAATTCTRHPACVSWPLPSPATWRRA